jgi:hypothetical protein
MTYKSKAARATRERLAEVRSALTSWQMFIERYEHDPTYRSLIAPYLSTAPVEDLEIARQAIGDIIQQRTREA